VEEVKAEDAFLMRAGLEESVMTPRISTPRSTPYPERNSQAQQIPEEGVQVCLCDRVFILCGSVIDGEKDAASQSMYGALPAPHTYSHYEIRLCLLKT
jgi:hypothetical protein